MIDILRYMVKNLWYRRKKQDKFDRTFKRLVKRRDKYRCTVTGKRYGLEVHHYYGVATHPHLRAVVSNGVLIHKSIHKEFHQWMGGYHVPCTRKDFIRFLRVGGGSNA